MIEKHKSFANVDVRLQVLAIDIVIGKHKAILDYIYIDQDGNIKRKPIEKR